MALPFFTATGHYTSATADGVDAGTDPDAVPLVGLTVVFMPSLMPPIIKDLDATPPASVKVDAITATTDATGALVALDGVSPVKLPASDYPNPATPWPWLVSVSGPTYPQQQFSFIGETGATVDLTTVLEAPGGSGYDVSAWSALVTRAEATVAAAVDAVPAEVDAVLADPDSAASTRLTATFAGLRDLDAMLTAPYYMGHRGGSRLHPENSMEAFRACAASGFGLELDVQSLVDGQLAISHDDTTNRAMTGTGASINTIAKDDFLSRRVKPATVGGRSGTPAMLVDVLAEFGGRVPMIVEIKAGGLADLTATYNLVKQMGLTRSIMLTSQTLAVCQAAADGLFPYVSFTASTDVVDVATIVASGISHISLDAAVSAAYANAALTAGLRVQRWTPTERADALGFIAAGAEGIITDDPWRTSRRGAPVASETFDSGYLWPMGDFSQSNPSRLTLSIDTAAAALRFSCLDLVNVGFGASRLGQFGEGTTECRIRFSAQFLGAATNQDRWFSLWVGSLPTDAPFNDSFAPAGPDGYSFLVRRNGTKQIYYRAAAGTTTTQLVQNNSTTFTADTVSKSALLEFEVVIDPTNVTLTCLTDGTSATVANTALRNSASAISFAASGTSVLLSEIRVSR